MASILDVSRTTRRSSLTMSVIRRLFYIPRLLTGVRESRVNRGRKSGGQVAFLQHSAQPSSWHIVVGSRRSVNGWVNG